MSNTNNRDFWNSRNKSAPTFNYTPSETVNTAWGNYNNYMNNNKPGNYAGTWLDEIKDVTDQILNRKDFSYDLNGDALYQQYKDQAVTQGKLASMDAIGQAAAMTGGHGNSYAQSVGQQAYQGYLQGLNDKIPELYQLALDQYNREGQDLYNQASLYAGLDEQEYNRNQNEWNNYYNELGVLRDNAKYLSDTEYNQALNNFNIYYGVHRHSVADSQWQQSFDYTQGQNAKNELITLMTATGYKPTDEELAAAGITRQQADAYIFSYENSQQEPETQGDRWYPTGRKDKEGNPIFTNGQGKEQAFGKYVNPHNGRTNSDTKYGVRENGYQPDNVASEYTDAKGNPDREQGRLTDTGDTDVINGERQPIYRTPDGKLWIWDDKKNKYREYE
jgi:hypothetical protein